MTNTPETADQRQARIVAEYAWLIERTDRTEWLCVLGDKPSAWTADANRALRLSRKEDAEALITWLDLPVSAIATEHAWDAIEREFTPPEGAGEPTCSLGEMHGMASTFTDAAGQMCCDFCGQPVPPEPAVDPLVERVAMELARQLRGGIADIEPDVRIGELTDEELARIATAALTATRSSRETPKSRREGQDG